jgi:hypothetical protein
MIQVYKSAIVTITWETKKVRRRKPHQRAIQILVGAAKRKK